MNYLLYNPKSSKGADKQKIESIKERLIGDVICQNVLEDDKYLEILQKLTKDDDVILVGGDGTLNKFVNKLGGKAPEARVYLYYVKIRLIWGKHFLILTIFAGINRFLLC